MPLLFLQHVARGAVGTPTLASIVEMGVPPSIRHLPPAGGMRGASHATCLAVLPTLVIQTGGCLGSSVRMEGGGCKCGGEFDFIYTCWVKVGDKTLKLVPTRAGNLKNCRHIPDLH